MEVVGREIDNSIESFEIEIFCVFEIFLLKKSKTTILVSDSANKSPLIILITFFDLTKIRKVTVFNEN